jgi:hypothetical protein
MEEMVVMDIVVVVVEVEEQVDLVVEMVVMGETDIAV